MKLSHDHPALTEKRTIHRKFIRPVKKHLTLLKSVSMNSKLGKGSNVITKGKWAGFPMFSLTLEERKTCPKSCERWDTCFGNNMTFAHRFEHGKKLEKQLEIELRKLSLTFRHGFVIRLHILGDFYSRGYVAFWRRMLQIYPNLHIFGYSAREGLIGSDLTSVRSEFPERFWVRKSRSFDFSGGDIYAGDPTKVSGIPCPEQNGGTESCLTCGLCWSTEKTVTFEEH